MPHHTVLTGTVKQGKHGTGRAYLGYSLYGLGQFGNVKVTLKSPPFQIQRFPFLARPASRPADAVAGTIERRPIDKPAGRPERRREREIEADAPATATNDLVKSAEPPAAVRIGVIHPVPAVRVREADRVSAKRFLAPFSEFFSPGTVAFCYRGPKAI